MRRAAATAVFCLLWSAGDSPAQPSFQVNLHTTGLQRTPDVAMAGDGRFVIVWASAGQDGSGFGVFGRMFSPPASPGQPPVAIGTEFQVNTYTTEEQSEPRVAASLAGDFVAIWRSFGQDGERGGIFGQRFGSSGLPAGGEFAVNSSTTGDQLYPDVAADAAGNFVVVWQTKADSSSISPVDIVARRFGSGGSPLAPEFTVSTETRASYVIELSPAVAVADDGRFVIVWSRPNAGGFYPRLYGRIYESSGQPAGGEFMIGDPFGYYEYQPSASMDGSGDFVVAWGGGIDFGMYLGTYGRRFGGDGIPKGSAFLVDPTFLRRGPDVAAAEDGSFIVAWREDKVRAARFDSAGAQEGAQIIVSQTGSSAALDVDPTRTFVVTWADADDSLDGIFGRRFGCPGAVSGLHAELAGAGDELVLTWTDLIDAESYVVFEDAAPGGPFATQSGSAVSGATGLTLPTPPGTVFYLVAAQNALCGMGPL